MPRKTKDVQCRCNHVLGSHKKQNWFIRLLTGNETRCSIDGCDCEGFTARVPRAQKSLQFNRPGGSGSRALEAIDPDWEKNRMGAVLHTPDEQESA